MCAHLLREVYQTVGLPSNLGLKLPGRLAALARDHLGPYRVMNGASASKTPARSLNPSR
ncbi:MAG: hypothetical protein ACHP7P_13850 [Terriglobales bacterium]